MLILLKSTVLDKAVGKYERNFLLKASFIQNPGFLLTLCYFSPGFFWTPFTWLKVNIIISLWNYSSTYPGKFMHKSWDPPILIYQNTNFLRCLVLSLWREKIINTTDFTEKAETKCFFLFYFLNCLHNPATSENSY